MLTDFGLGPIPFEHRFLLALGADGTPLDQVAHAEGPWRTFLTPLSDGSIAYSGFHLAGITTANIVFGLLDPPAP